MHDRAAVIDWGRHPGPHDLDRVEEPVTRWSPLDELDLLPEDLTVLDVDA